VTLSPKGFPYPEPTAPVSAGAGDIKALALAIEAQLMGYGTTFPAAPIDGQEYVLVDSLTAPSFRWRFRYNASATTNKWEFLGGSPLSYSQGSALSIPANAWTNVAAGTLLVKRAGVYLVKATATLYNPNATTAAAATLSLYKNAAAGGNALLHAAPMTVYASGRGQVSVPEHVETLAANDLIGVMGFTDLANTNFGPGTFSLVPVAVT